MYDPAEFTVQPPKAAYSYDVYRINEQSMRFRVLQSGWREDALWREQSFFAREVRDQLPEPEISRNPAQMIYEQTSTLYDEEPTIKTTEDTERAFVDISAISTPSLWALQQERLYLTEGINECLMRVVVTKTMPGLEAIPTLSYRIVPPSVILHATAAPADNTRLIYVEELRWDHGTPEVKPHWISQIWDMANDYEEESEEDQDEPTTALSMFGEEAISDMAAEEVEEASFDPVDTVEPSRRGRLGIRSYDEFGKEIGGVVWQPWPDEYRDRQGNPVMPYVIYHKRVGADVWNVIRGREVFWGTLTTASLWTFWLFGVRDAAFAQRWVRDMMLKGTAAGGSSEGTKARKNVTNPMTILEFMSTKESGGAAGEWKSTMSAKETGEAIEQFMAGLAMYAGISPSDITIGSSNQSGYSIVVSREGVRKARKRQQVPCRMSDQILLSTAARIWNANVTQSDLPEQPTDYLVTYAPQQMSPAERAAETDDVLKRLENGLMDPVDAYMRLNPGVTPDAAADALMKIQKSRALMSAAARPPADRATQLEMLMKMKEFLTAEDFTIELQRIGIIPPDKDPLAYMTQVQEERRAEEALNPPITPPSSEE